MFRTALTTTTALLAMAAGGAAYAGSYEPAPAEPVVMAPPPAPMDTTGDWGGFYGGAQLAYGFGDIADDDVDGYFAGLFAGYNWDFGRYVLGVEGDLNYADGSWDGGPDESGMLGHLKLRGGYDMGRTLIYATGGAAYADVDSTPGLSDWGWAVGAGVDYQMTERWIGGVEYLYHDFSDFDGTGADANAHTIAARVSMRF